MSTIQIPIEYFAQLGLADGNHYGVVVKLLPTRGVPVVLSVSTTWDGETGEYPRKPQRLIVFDGFLVLQTDASGNVVPIDPAIILFDQQGNPLTPGTWKQTLRPKSTILTIVPLQRSGVSGPWESNDPAPSGLYPELEYVPASPGDREGSDFSLGYRDQFSGGGGGREHRRSLVLTISGPGVIFAGL